MLIVCVLLLFYTLMPHAEPLDRLTGHTAMVTRIIAMDGLLISASWDRYVSSLAMSLGLLSMSDCMVVSYYCAYVHMRLLSIIAYYRKVDY